MTFTSKRRGKPVRACASHRRDVSPRQRDSTNASQRPGDDGTGDRAVRRAESCAGCNSTCRRVAAPDSRAATDRRVNRFVTEMPDARDDGPLAPDGSVARKSHGVREIVASRTVGSPANSPPDRSPDARADRRRHDEAHGPGAVPCEPRRIDHPRAFDATALAADVAPEIARKLRCRGPAATAGSTPSRASCVAGSLAPRELRANTEYVCAPGADSRADADVARARASAPA